MIAKDLKQMINMIPDEAIMMICGNPKAEITEIKVENLPEGFILADLSITKGYFLASEAVIKKWLENAAYRK